MTPKAGPTFPPLARRLRAALLACAVALAGAGSALCDSRTPDGAVSDLHNSVLFRLFTAPGGLRDDLRPVNLSGLQSAHAKFLFLSIGIPEFSLRTRQSATLEDVLTFLERQCDTALGCPDDLQFAGDQAQLANALRCGRIAFAFGLEGVNLLKGDETMVDRLRAVGVRKITIAHWFQNEFIRDPVSGPKEKRGPALLTDKSVLTEKGRALVERMIAQHILIDLSHLGRDAFAQVVALNARRTPLLASHSNARALRDVPRNLDDAQIRAIADTGGLIGVCLHTPLLVPDGQTATVADVARQMDHLVKIAGVTHVALGTDFEGGITPPPGLAHFSDLPRLREELTRLGYSPEDMDKLLWQNVLRILPEP